MRPVMERPTCSIDRRLEETRDWRTDYDHLQRPLIHARTRYYVECPRYPSTQVRCLVIRLQKSLQILTLLAEMFAR